MTEIPHHKSEKNTSTELSATEKLKQQIVNDSVETISLTERDIVEKKIKEIFGDKILRTEDAGEIIQPFKDGNYALSQMGMMLYTNGHNLRGRSSQFPNGMLYYDGQNIFGIGYFAKEEETKGHLMIVAPTGAKITKAVQDFIETVRGNDISDSSIYIRHLSDDKKDEFLQAGMSPILEDPWHSEAIEEDETFPNRIFSLKEIIGEDMNILNLEEDDHNNHKKKNRMSHHRFCNFLKRNNLKFKIQPYGHLEQEVEDGESIIKGYFDARKKRGGVIGSTQEDYFPLFQQKVSGENEKDYFSYVGYLQFPSGLEIPMMFFAGEKIAQEKVGLYATLTLRFDECIPSEDLDMQGFTAIPQYAWLEVFKRLKQLGIKEVDGGGSETKGLDNQKRQLGGNPDKTHWVVALQKEVAL